MIFGSGVGSEPSRHITVFSPTRPTTANAKQSPRFIMTKEPRVKFQKRRNGTKDSNCSGIILVAETDRYLIVDKAVLFKATTKTHFQPDFQAPARDSCRAR